MVLFGRSLQIAVEARILATLLAVDECRHIPGLLIAQRCIAVRHIVLDEVGSLVDVMHAGAPVIGVLAPQRWEHGHIADKLALTVCSVA